GERQLSARNGERVGDAEVPSRRHDSVGGQGGGDRGSQRRVGGVVRGRRGRVVRNFDQEPWAPKISSNRSIDPAPENACRSDRDGGQVDLTAPCRDRDDVAAWTRPGFQTVS